MSSNKNLDLEAVLEILEERVLQHTGRYLSPSEMVLIKGSWDGKDYKEIANDSGYNVHYLQTGVGTPLWTMLTEVVGEGVQVKKLTLRNILLKLAKKEYLKKLEASYQNVDRLIGTTRLYGDFPKITSFYGRQDEISILKKEVNLLKKRCISLIGIAGIGKSLLASKLIEEILLENSNNYEYVIWKTIKRSSTIDNLVTDIIKSFNIEQAEDITLQSKLSLLLNYLQLHCCLLVLDGFEAIAPVNIFEKRLEYEDFFVGITQEKHQSCVIVTSQVPLKEITYVNVNSSIVSIQIEGLEEDAAIQLMREKGIAGEKCKELIETYRGNPSELEAVSDRINRIFGGSLEKFFDYRTTVIGPRVEAMLNLQFGQSGLLTDLQKQVMVYLAEEMAKSSALIPFSKLINDLKERLKLEAMSISKVISALEALEQRSLIEASKKSSKHELSYGMEPVIKKYILVDPYGLVYKSSNKKELTTYVQGQNSP